MTYEFVRCPDCDGAGLIREKVEYSDTDMSLCSTCNPDPKLRMMGIPGPNSGWVAVEDRASSCTGRQK